MFRPRAEEIMTWSGVLLGAGLWIARYGTIALLYGQASAVVDNVVAF